MKRFVKSASIGLFGMSMVFALAGCPQNPPIVPVYQITVENMSASQPISPIVAATHSPGIVMFRAGTDASPGIIAVAENGDPAPLVAALEAIFLVTDIHNVGEPLTRMGTTADNFTDTATFELQSKPGDVLSLVGMLIATNDGFAGVDSTGLPTAGTKVVYALGYDAGSEDNTEMSEDIVDAASALGPVALEGDPNGNDNAGPDTDPAHVVMMHPGIQGGEDLSVEDHGWREPVLKVTITRMD